MMRVKSLLTGLLLLALPALPAHAAVAPDHGPNRIDAEDCLEAVPAEVSAAGLTDDGHEVQLDMLVLLDGLTTHRGMAIVAAMQDAYAPLGAKLVPRFEEVTFPADGQSDPDPDGFSTPFIYTDKLFELAKAHVGGFRPWGTDLVYTVTSKELMSTGALGGSVAGQADCIGGIRYPDVAFAIGESNPPEFEQPGNIVSANFTAKVASHEVAHLLGAHHHYANCIEGEKTALARLELSPCTMMFNDVGLISLHFGTLEASVIRGHLLAFADDTPTGEIPSTEREATLRLKRDEAKGAVSSNQPVCVDQVPVELQRKSRYGWKSVASSTSEATGAFSIPYASSKGNYRVSLPEAMRHGSYGWTRCAVVASPVTRRR